MNKEIFVKVKKKTFSMIQLIQLVQMKESVRLLEFISCDSNNDLIDSKRFGIYRFFFLPNRQQRKRDIDWFFSWIKFTNFLATASKLDLWGKFNREQYSEKKPSNWNVHVVNGAGSASVVIVVISD